MSIHSLQEALLKVIQFFEQSPGSSSARWMSILSDIHQDLGSSALVNNAVTRLHQYFGGMGTLNDVVFCAVNENVPAGISETEADRRFSKLLDKCYRELQLLNASVISKIYWRLLELRHAGDLPPRIKSAFAIGAQQTIPADRPKTGSG